MRSLRPLPTIALLASLSLAAWGFRSAREQGLRERLLVSAPEALLEDPALGPYALRQGSIAYRQHCASCHGAAGAGDSRRGVPALASGHWLYGTGRVAELEHTILYGIRSGHPKSWNLASMPAFATARPYRAYAIQPLTPAEIDAVTAYLLSLRGLAVDPAAASRGAAVFHGTGGCYDCHGEDAKGDPAIGAPDLTGARWLSGDGSAASLRATISEGLAGRCPAWIDRLAPATIRALAVYVHSLPIATHD